MIKKCVFPGCKVTGEVGTSRRPHTCETHTQWLVTGYKTVVGVGSAVVAAASERYVTKKTPWWAKAALEGLKNGR